MKWSNQSIIFGIVIFALPVLGYFYVSRLSSVDYYFDAGQYQATPEIAKQKILEKLEYEEKTIKFFDPFIKFGSEWFLYNVSFENKMKLAVEISNPKSYTEHETILTIQSENGSTIVPFGEGKYIAQNIQKEHILEKIKDFNFIIIPNETVGQNEEVKIQHSPLLGGAIIKIRLIKSLKIFLLIYTTFWVFITGILVLIKESMKIIKNGFAYFK